MALNFSGLVMSWSRELMVGLTAILIVGFGSIIAIYNFWEVDFGDVYIF